MLAQLCHKSHLLTYKLMMTQVNSSEDSSEASLFDSEGGKGKVE